MNLQDIQMQIKRIWTTYGTVNNFVLVIGLAVALGWVLGTLSAIQTNFEAQKSVDSQKRQLQLTQLEVDTLKYQQSYYKSDEYKELSARKNLGLVLPGEKMLILPPNSPSAKQASLDDATRHDFISNRPLHKTNFRQWIDFFSGKDAQSLQE